MVILKTGQQLSNMETTGTSVMRCLSYQRNVHCLPMVIKKAAIQSSLMTPSSNEWKPKTSGLSLKTMAKVMDSLTD